MKVNGIKCKNQTEAVLQYLKGGKYLDQTTATKLFGTQRLGAIVYDLRHNIGYNVEKVDCKGRNKFGNPVNFCKYYLPVQNG
tara:strand:- start:2983 stop:3228 length:246 start_codon:yes stop_codon:yes gene_type:complete